MNQIKIIADSTCDLSEELLEKYNISILPLMLSLDDKILKMELRLRLKISINGRIKQEKLLKQRTTIGDTQSFNNYVRKYGYYFLWYFKLCLAL